MKDYSCQNKKAWEYNVYNFWIKEAGSPAERAQKDMENPKGMLKKYASYFDTYEGIRIANICGSCGKKAIPLAIRRKLPTLSLRSTPIFKSSSGTLTTAIPA